MKRISTLNVKRTAELVPGELARVNFGSAAALILFMQRVEGGDAVLGVLESMDFGQPMTWLKTPLDGDCLAYGVDWVLEEEHGPETATSLRYRHERACLHLDKNGLVMSFRPARGTHMYRSFHFNVSSSSPQELSDVAAPINKWRVWESSEYRDSGAAPLFIGSTCEPPQPR